MVGVRGTWQNKYEPPWELSDEAEFLRGFCVDLNRPEAAQPPACYYLLMNLPMPEISSLRTVMMRILADPVAGLDQFREHRDLVLVLIIA